MKIGQLMFFQNHPNLPQTDVEMYQSELEIASMTEEMGMDSIWGVEHHFTDYTLCPNIPMFLAFMAARTKHIGLGTAAIILPWHKDPIRVATDLAMLDNLSNGRVLFGVGRGLAQVEYDGLGIDMGESRDRMNESLEMILPALESGTMDTHDGKHFKQLRRDIRPAPFKSFKDRSYFVSMSPDTIPHAAHFGGRIMSFALGPWEQRAVDLNLWRELYFKEHGHDAPKPVANTLVFCDNDASRAADMAAKYMADYFVSAIQHYDMDEDHFAKKGKGKYDFYQDAGKMLADAGREASGQNFKDLQVFGTPAQCMEKIKYIEDTTGVMDLNCVFSYGGMPYDDAKASLKLFAEECIPTMKPWGEEAKAAE